MKYFKPWKGNKLAWISMIFTGLLLIAVSAVLLHAQTELRQSQVQPLTSFPVISGNCPIVSGASAALIVNCNTNPWTIDIVPPVFKILFNIPTFVDNETPSGTINGTNAAFTLANPPASTLHLYRNGLRQNPAIDYSVSGSTITDYRH